MLEKMLIDYYNNIEPSSHLIERTVNMSQNNKNKSFKMPKRTLSILIAAIILALGITGYAAGTRIINDKRGIVAQSQDAGFVFDFSKADVTPKKYSDPNALLVQILADMGYTDVVLPKAILDESMKVYNKVNPFLMEKGSMLELKNDSIDVSLQIFRDMTLEEMNGFYGTGDENTICEVINVNGIDVCLNLEGSDDSGYYAYLFYATGSNLYCINYNLGNNYDIAHDNAIGFVKTISQ